MTSDILDPGESDHGFNVTSHEKSDGDVELDVVLNPNSDSDWDSDESKEHIDNITKGESVDNIEKNNIPSDYGIQSKMPETQTETRTDQRNSESDKTIPSYVAKGTEQPHSPFTTGGDEPRENEGHSSGSGSDWDSDCGSLLDELDEENKKTTKPDPLSTSDNHTKTAPFAESDIPKGNSTPIVPMTSDILDPGEADQRFKVTSHEKTGGEVELDVVQNLKSDSDWDSDEPERSTNAASKCTAKFGKSQASDNHTTPASTTRTDVTRDSQDKATPPMTLESLDHGESELKLHVTSHEISGGEVEMDVVLNPNSDSDCDSNESEEHCSQTKYRNINSKIFYS
ncbi:uncharacterized protein [Argopecten irradians]|uniref:uncharacterized protein n=1 Tax=Argopecten irradians TaxID=31199 RepID=UPI003719F08E